MLTSVSFENFKNLKAVTCDFEQLTVIVGPNACGKTSILEGMHYLSQLVRDYSPDAVLQLFRANRSLANLHHGDGSQAMSIECRSAEEYVNFKAALNGNELDRDRLGDTGWNAGLVGGRNPGAVMLLGGNRLGSSASTLAVAQHIRSLVFLHLEASRLARPSYSDREIPRVEYSGTGLATVLAAMRLEDSDNFAAVLDMMRAIVPHLKGLKIRRQKIHRKISEIIEINGRRRRIPRDETTVGEALYFDFDNRQSIPANNVSEGTLLALGLITVLQSPTRPKVVLLDDIEKGLHPAAQKSLVGILRQIMKLNDDLQIIATTHSPFFLDFLDPSEVRVMTVNRVGDSICGHLNAHPDFEKWKHELAPGEMWSVFGESWLVSGDTSQ